MGSQLWKPKNNFVYEEQKQTFATLPLPSNRNKAKQ